MKLFKPSEQFSSKIVVSVHITTMALRQSQTMIQTQTDLVLQYLCARFYLRV